MACAKPPSSSGLTPPSSNPPAPLPIYSALRKMEETISTKPPSETVDRAIKYADECLASAVDKGVRGAELRSIQNRIEELKHFAVLRQRDAIGLPGPAEPRSRNERSLPLDKALERFTETDSKRESDRVVKALADRSHWQHKEYCEHLVKVIQGNDSLPQEYKDQLPSDVAAVVRACPEAGGLVKELTLRGQRKPTGSSSKLGSRGRSGIGSAYEIMGTAALTRRVIHSGNNGPSLWLNSQVDHVTFGDKAVINRTLSPAGFLMMPTRRTVECDLRIGRPPTNMLLGDQWREIGVDFKHVKRGEQRSYKPDDHNQIQNVANVIRDGTIDEYHFVTNGSFDSKFKSWVAEANAELTVHGHTPIAYHEHVTTI